MIGTLVVFYHDDGGVSILHNRVLQFSADLLFLKAYLWVSRLAGTLSLMCLRLRTSFSKHLIRMGVRATGWCALRLDTAEFSVTGMMMTVLRQEGTVSYFPAHVFSTRPGILSWPAALFIFTLSSSFLTSAVVTTHAVFHLRCIKQSFSITSFTMPSWACNPCLHQTCSWVGPSCGRPASKPKIDAQLMSVQETWEKTFLKLSTFGASNWSL